MIDINTAIGRGIVAVSKHTCSHPQVNNHYRMCSLIIFRGDSYGGNSNCHACTHTTHIAHIHTYTHTVEPSVKLSLSPKVVRVGSSVDVICRAESYPPANNEDNYQIRHPHNKNISHMLLEDGSGVVHQIQAANKKEDTGEYECTVTLTLSDYGERIQSELYKANLTVYGT